MNDAIPFTYEFVIIDNQHILQKEQMTKRNKTYLFNLWFPGCFLDPLYGIEQSAEVCLLFEKDWITFGKINSKCRNEH